RKVTWERMGRMCAATLEFTPRQNYTVADRVEQRASAHPERPFLHFRDRVLSYGEINAEANRVAHFAIREGLRRGDVVALMMENRPEFITTWIGLAKLGVVTALVNTNLRGRPLRHALETTEAKLAIAGSECLGALRGLGLSGRSRKVHVLSDPESPGTASPDEDIDSILSGMPTTNPDSSVREGLTAGDDLFYIFTSGTTGLPKAARYSHLRFFFAGETVSAAAEFDEADVIGCVLPLYHGAAGVVVISCALARGAAIALRRKFSASRFWDDARRYRITAFQYIGEVCRYLLNRPSRPDDREHSIRVMVGAGLRADVWGPFQARFGVDRILEGWSSTESNVNLLNLDNRIGSCGRIPFREFHNGRLIRVDSDTGEVVRDARGFCVECGPNEPGEMIGSIPDDPELGPGRFEGYTSVEATEQKILRDVFRPGDRWFRSGDLLRRDEEDYYYFVDRIGDTFRWKSENVSTQEVAESLSGFPGLELANVYGVEVPGTEGRAGMAALVMRDPAAFDGRAFFDLTSARLPSYAAPVFVRIQTETDLDVQVPEDRSAARGLRPAPNPGSALHP
ncbi:MAG: long-chain-acyl-CoA synthetase, partial [Candidatus Binatia bacterium]